MLLVNPDQICGATRFQGCTSRRASPRNLRSKFIQFPPGFVCTLQSPRSPITTLTRKESVTFDRVLLYRRLMATVRFGREKKKINFSQDLADLIAKVCSVRTDTRIRWNPHVRLCKISSSSSSPSARKVRDRAYNALACPRAHPPECSGLGGSWLRARDFNLNLQ